ncbi:rCG55934 [Rattus norvegicus]|uniref:RCG55934 n=1 Tax=Rattus norvegicus TaxID=10116 RepID=A6JLV6_RAT|nr:rCG55934 [Rattus norvegicus]
MPTTVRESLRIDQS